MVDNPLHLRAHSKAVLTAAINNDTQFLSSHLVMDYSLLVGLDESSKELVVGIIGNIRFLKNTDLLYVFSILSSMYIYLFKS